MPITKTFANTFRDMMRAKLRGFIRRSILRYALAVALVTGIPVEGGHPAVDPVAGQRGVVEMGERGAERLDLRDERQEHRVEINHSRSRWVSVNANVRDAGHQKGSGELGDVGVPTGVQS